MSDAAPLTDNELSIRFPQPGDEADLVAFHTRNRVFFTPSGSVHPETHLNAESWTGFIRKSTEELERGLAVRFLVYHQVVGTVLIGKINYTQIFRGPFHACYLGYALDESFRGRGLMTRALRLTNDFMFRRMNIHRIMANYLPENTASARILEKLGFVKEGIAKDYLRINGVWRDHVLTSLTNPDWQTPAKSV